MARIAELEAALAYERQLTAAAVRSPLAKIRGLGAALDEAYRAADTAAIAA